MACRTQRAWTEPGWGQQVAHPPVRMLFGLYSLSWCLANGATEPPERKVVLTPPLVAMSVSHLSSLVQSSLLLLKCPAGFTVT